MLEILFVSPNVQRIHRIRVQVGRAQFAEEPAMEPLLLVFSVTAWACIGVRPKPVTFKSNVEDFYCIFKRLRLNHPANYSIRLSNADFHLQLICGTKTKGQAEVPNVQAAGCDYVGGFPFLQRTLPRD